MTSITLPWPPSVNAMWRTPNSGPLAGRTLLSQEGRNYRKAVQQAVTEQRPTLFVNRPTRVAVEIEVRMPNRIRRDIDNIPKAVLDGLTHAGVWPDDSCIDDLRVWRAPELTPGGCVVVSIRAIVQPQLEIDVRREIA